MQRPTVVITKQVVVSSVQCNQFSQEFLRHVGKERFQSAGAVVEAVFRRKLNLQFVASSQLGQHVFCIFAYALEAPDEVVIYVTRSADLMLWTPVPLQRFARRPLVNNVLCKLVKRDITCNMCNQQ